MLPPHPQLRACDLRRPPSVPSLPRLIDEAGVHRFFNARAALYQLARALRARGRDRVLLPAFHCPSVVEPILRAGMRPVFYRIDRNLEVDLADVRRRIDGNVAAAVFINFLGFPSRFEPLLAELRAREVLVVEDCAHACVSVDPLELSGRRADAAVYSFWKLVPSGVGGGLWLAQGAPLQFPRLQRAPLADSVVRAKRLAEQVITGMGDDSALARAYALAESTRVHAKKWLLGRRAGVARSAAPAPAAGPVTEPPEPSEYFFSERLASSKLPWMAERIMARADLAALVEARRGNYETLTARLQPAGQVACVLPTLPPRISPLAYPIFMPERSTHDLRLRARDVPVWTFGSTLHRAVFETADAGVLADARYLSDELLLISVHHMLTRRNAEEYADTINQYCSEAMTCAST